VRTSKIMTFSVPPIIEEMIHKHANQEHMTISEFLRSAIRKYIALRELENISKKGSKISKKNKLHEDDVNEWIKTERKK